MRERLKRAPLRLRFRDTTNLSLSSQTLTLEPKSSLIPRRVLLLKSDTPPQTFVQRETSVPPVSKSASASASAYTRSIPTAFGWGPYCSSNIMGDAVAPPSPLSTLLFLHKTPSAERSSTDGGCGVQKWGTLAG